MCCDVGELVQESVGGIMSATIWEATVCVCVCVFPAANMEFPLFLISAIASWCNSLPVIYISHTCLDALTQPEMDRERERDGERERDSDMERTRVHTQTTTKPCVAIHSSKDEDTNSSGN